MDRTARLSWRLLPPSMLVVAAAWWVFVYVGGASRGVHSYDIYADFYPNVDYALRSLREGHGLLWNPLQNCGQPFLPSTLLGPFYPLNLVFPLLGLDRGLLVIAFLHLAVAGLGTYLLCREIGLGRSAALCGGIAFEFSRAVTQLAGWLPSTILGSFVWLPLAMFCCERTLRAPTLRAGVWLGVVLTLSVLGAYPQMTVFIYQMLVLRIVWEGVTGRWRAVLRASGALAVALLLPLALGAAYLAPATEFAARSLRDHPLRPDELSPGGFVRMADLRDGLAARSLNFWPGTIAFAALAPLGFINATTRRQACFCALATAAFIALAVDGPIQRLYLALPGGSSFRLPSRFIWVATFTLFVLAALGAEALNRATGGRRLWLALLVLLGAGSILLAVGSHPRPEEVWAVAALVLLAMLPAAAASSRSLRWVALAGVPLVVAASALHLSQILFFTFTDGHALLHGDAPVFELLRSKVTAQDRFYAVAKNMRYGLTEKTASVFGIPSISDYEPQTSRRFADLIVLLVRNTPMQSINDFGLKFTRAPQNRRILDLLATRYLVVDPAADALPPELRASLRLLASVGGIAIYENPDAFPRAFYVPSARFEPDPAARLRMLASGNVDLHRTVLLETMPPDGAGTPSDAAGTATIEEDRSELVRVRVHADAPGFLVLTDQDYPGWTATVNGIPRTVLRANHAFRAVAVPSGESTVTFRYRPTRLWVGIGISLVALAAVVGLLWRTRDGKSLTPKLNRLGEN